VVRVPGRLVYVSAGKLTGVGSPVFDSTGRAIGMVGRQQLFLSFQTATRKGVVPLPLKGVQETSFFVPVEEFVGALRRIPDPKKKPRRLPWMGILKFDGVGKPLADLVGLEVAGVMIGKVVPDSPAATAKLKERDIIVEMNGKPLEELATPDLTARNLVRKMLRLKIGAKITLTVFREKKKIPATVTLEAMPLRPSEAKRHFSAPLGLGLREKVPMDYRIGVGPTANVKGMVVIQLQREGPAHRARVNVGDLVTHIDEHFVARCEDVKKTVKAAIDDKARTTVKLLVRRGDKALPIVVQLRRTTAVTP
jgi:serine protease Do